MAEPTFIRNGMSMRTPAGPVDLVALYRRLDGDMTVRMVDDEKLAAALALTHMGVAMYLITKVVNWSTETTKAALARYGMQPVMNASTFSWESVASGRTDGVAKRRAERVEIDGRMVHPRAKHGTVHAYSHYACRCLPCTDVHAAKRREARAA